nr:MAG TPA: hypothetical protein [Microviridae sp.]
MKKVLTSVIIESQKRKKCMKITTMQPAKT